LPAGAAVGDPRRSARCQRCPASMNLACCWQILIECGARPARTGFFPYPYRAARWYQGEKLEQVGIAQPDAAMGKRHTHGFRIGRAMQIDVAPEGIDLPHPVVTRLAAAEPENTGQDPVAPGKLCVQLRIPDLARPAPAAQERR